MFWIFKLSFVVDILACFDLATFWATFKKFGDFFSYHLVTLLTTEKSPMGPIHISRLKVKLKRTKRYFFYVGSHLEQN
jgi:hypothetical protein